MTRPAGPFFDVPRTSRPTSQGTVEFPILYHDASMVLAVFLADAGAVAAEVAAEGLRPGMTAGRRAAVMLVGYDYRATTIGPYREVGLAVPVVPEHAPPGPRWHQALRDVQDPGRDLGYHVLHLPVTTEAANAAGREAWGLPKFVTPIDVRFRGRDLAVRVEDPGRDAGAEPVLALTGRAGIGVPGPSLGLVLYSRLGDEALRTAVDVRGGGTLRPPGSVRLRVGGGHHPMADTLRRLGLDGARPVAVVTTHDFQSRLNLGTPVGLPAPTPARPRRV